MKWFFALNETSAIFQSYADMIKVAVHTALKHTSLVPYFLYDGSENDLTEWLRRRNVTIIRCRTSLYDRLADLAEQRNDRSILSIGSGAFLRTEIPGLASDHGIHDTYVLYTDCDVMFLREVCDSLADVQPRYFAVAPEKAPDEYCIDYRKMNSGVMLMNLRNLAADDRRFRAFVARNLHRFIRNGWDQDAYRKFYTARWTKRPRWDRLPLEFNWRPYWGDFSSARIVHFHGPKPYEREEFEREEGADPRHVLSYLARGSYDELSRLWDDIHGELG